MKLETDYIHPASFTLGFLLYILDGLFEHPRFNDTSFEKVNLFIDLLLQHWGVTTEEIQTARDLLSNFLDDPTQEWGEAYKAATINFVRSTPERTEMWLCHIYGVLVLQNLLLDDEVNDKTKLFIYNQGKRLKMADEQIDQVANSGLGLGITGTLLVRQG